MPRSRALPGRSVRAAAIASALLVAALCAGCGIDVPTDPRGTLDHIESTRIMRVGATPAGDALRVDGQSVAGPLADLVEGFANEHGAAVHWLAASEETLVNGLERGDIDIAVGAMTDATPWTDRVSVTRGYPGIEGADGKRLVVMLPLGENALQSAIEQYFDDEVGE